MTEKQIIVDKVNPLLLFGQNDTNLKQIEAAFPETRIVARGNRLMLHGDSDDLEKIDQVIQELSLVLNRNGHLTENDVATILDLLRIQGQTARRHSGETILFTPNGGLIQPKTEGQRKIVNAAAENDIVFSIGPAGTGKTYLAVAIAVAALNSHQVKRIVLSRPAVEAGESLGFLPGDFRDKIDPYLRPLYDALDDMLPKERLFAFLEQNTIEIVPLAYMRGRTLNSAFMILDEAQNATPKQMKMFLTRLGPNSRAIVTGDITQSDLPNSKTSGLVQVQNILHGVDGISFEYLTKHDVVRHQLVQDIIEAYDKFEGE